MNVACVHGKSLQSCLTVCDHGLQPARLLCPWDSPGKNTAVGCHALLQGVFPTQRVNPCLFCLLHWQVGFLGLVPPGKPSYLSTAAAAAKSLQSCPTLCLPAKLLQSCPTLCNRIDGSPPGLPIPGILQARTLEWVAISFSNV